MRAFRLTCRFRQASKLEGKVLWGALSTVQQPFCAFYSIFLEFIAFYGSITCVVGLTGLRFWSSNCHLLFSHENEFIFSRPCASAAIKLNKKCSNSKFLLHCCTWFVLSRQSLVAEGFSESQLLGTSCFSVHCIIPDVALHLIFIYSDSPVCFMWF